MVEDGVLNKYTQMLYVLLYIYIHHQFYFSLDGQFRVCDVHVFLEADGERRHSQLYYMYISTEVSGCLLSTGISEPLHTTTKLISIHSALRRKGHRYAI